MTFMTYTPKRLIKRNSLYCNVESWVNLLFDTSVQSGKKFNRKYWTETSKTIARDHITITTINNSKQLNLKSFGKKQKTNKDSPTKTVKLNGILAIALLCPLSDIMSLKFPGSCRLKENNWIPGATSLELKSATGMNKLVPFSITSTSNWYNPGTTLPNWSRWWTKISILENNWKKFVSIIQVASQLERSNAPVKEQL